MTLVVGTNSYQILDDITDYLAESIRAAAWVDVDEEVQIRAGASAFRILERQRWGGTVVDGATCAFPRDGLVDLNGQPISSASMPAFILAAQAELAFDLSQDASLAATSDTGQKIARVQAGSASVEFFRPTEASRFPPAIVEIIAPYLLGATSLYPEVVANGTCDDSRFYASDGVYPFTRIE